jgi:hypothetical protein
VKIRSRHKKAPIHVTGAVSQPSVAPYLPAPGTDLLVSFWIVFVWQQAVICKPLTAIFTLRNLASVTQAIKTDLAHDFLIEKTAVIYARHSAVGEIVKDNLAVIACIGFFVWFHGSPS